MNITLFQGKKNNLKDVSKKLVLTKYRYLILKDAIDLVKALRYAKEGETDLFSF